MTRDDDDDDNDDDDNNNRVYYYYYYYDYVHFKNKSESVTSKVEKVLDHLRRPRTQISKRSSVLSYIYICCFVTVSIQFSSGCPGEITDTSPQKASTVYGHTHKADIILIQLHYFCTHIVCFNKTQDANRVPLLVLTDRTCNNI